MSAPIVRVLDNEDALADTVAEALAVVLASPGMHHIAVTGGGVGTLVLDRLARHAHQVDWDRVHLWWGDERFLPHGDPERNETSARAALIDHVPIPECHVHPMPADEGQGVDAAALAYADELSRASSDGTAPEFDVLLLGVGPDGHVASLFPQSPALRAGASVVAVHDAPKPPPTRISLSLPTIRSARSVWLVASGSAKAPAITRSLDDTATAEDVPAAAARGQIETVLWLDRPAAADVASGSA